MHSGACPDFQKLELYHYGKISGEELFAIENHLATCEMCNDYVEGLEQLSNTSVLNNIESELKEKIYELLNLEKQKKRFLVINKRWVVAASLLFLIGIGSYVYFITQKPQQVISKLEPQQKTKTIEKETKLLDTTSNKNNVIADLPKASLKRAINKPEIPETKNISAEDLIITESAASVEEVTKNNYAKNEEEVKSAPMQAYKEEQKLKVLTNVWPSKDERIITGTVRDSIDGSPLFGAIISIKGRNIGTYTDVNGKFTLKIPNDNSTMIFQYLGYKRQELEMKPQDSELNIAMTELANQQMEVVVSTQARGQRASIKSSLTTVSDKELKISNDAQSALQGRATGVQISQNYDDLKPQLLNYDLIKKIALNYLEAKDKANAIDQLKNLQKNTSDTANISQIQKIIDLTQNDQFTKALRQLKRLK